jgi:hypothetical protein
MQDQFDVGADRCELARRGTTTVLCTGSDKGTVLWCFGQYRFDLSPDIIKRFVKTRLADRPRRSAGSRLVDLVCSANPAQLADLTSRVVVI